ncbi:hypothetical protein DPMN_077255 [Dreissena polymorpha]|uniref:Uncharacterized protein n=1 Tax=Dreissena polymorpha TaxID=45954 RepID=A0A9D3YK59_DREPO|nr:hypothetical protein DPMN_077255 [Dreissena polymorpha]
MARLLMTYIIGTHCLIKCHDDRTINVVARVNKTIAKQYMSPTGSTIAQIISPHRRKNATPPGAHESTGTIFELAQDIIGTSVLTKCIEDWTINVASNGQKAITKTHH